jgi:hypothetical protein
MNAMSVTVVAGAMMIAFASLALLMRAIGAA